MRTPLPRGPLSNWVVELLDSPPDEPSSLAHDVAAPGPTSEPSSEPTWSGWPASGGRDDEAITLWMLQELHYRGFDGVDDRWEWNPTTVALRARLEAELEERLRKQYADADPSVSDDVVADVRAVIAADSGASLARHVQRDATHEQTCALLRQRSVYHLKEADPTAWVVPRLSGRPKAALMEVQFDEYGNGDPARLHHRLFEQGLVASGLSADYGAYVDEAVTEILEQNTALSMFGLQRRLRGAALGHLAAFEATSSIPSRQLAQGLRRLGFPEAMAAYYDEHVEADAVHEQLALRDVCQALVSEEPELADDVRFGAWACLHLEARTARVLLEQWDAA